MPLLRTQVKERIHYRIEKIGEIEPLDFSFVITFFFSGLSSLAAEKCVR